MTRFLVQALLGLGVLALLLWRVDILDAARRVDDVDTRLLLPALLLFTASKGVHAYRWRLLLGHRSELPWTELFALFLAGNFANSLLPLRAGDLLRIEVPSRRHGIPRAELASGVVVVESLLDGVAFVALALAALTVVELPRPLVPPFTLGGAVILGAFVAAVLAAQSGEEVHIARWAALRLFPMRMREAIVRRVAEAVAGMAAFRNLGVALLAFALSCFAWSTEVTTYYLVAQAFSLALSFPETLLVSVAANLVVAVPLTPWNIGQYEVAMTELLTLIGADRVAASAFAIGSHLLVMAWIGVTGMVALWSLGLSVRELLPRRSVVAPDPSRRA